MLENILEDILKDFQVRSVSGVIIEIVPSIDFSNARALWMGIPFDELEAPHFEQILWELHEFCFQFMFHALDECARSQTPML